MYSLSNETEREIFNFNSNLSPLTYWEYLIILDKLYFTIIGKTTREKKQFQVMYCHTGNGKFRI